MERRSLHVRLQWLALVASLLAIAESTSAASEPSAEEMVDAIVKDESKVDSVRSLYLRLEGVVELTPEAVARLKAEQLKQPGARIDLRPRRTEELELAFDNKRVRRFSHVHDRYLEVSVFDGAQAVGYTKYFTHDQEQYVLSRSPTEFFQDYFLALSWPRMGVHSFWFVHDKFGSDRARITGYAKDYTLIGESDFRGRRCYVLENRLAWRRVHVGVDDRRLHGWTWFAISRGVDRFPAEQRVAGRTFADRAEWSAWLKTLSSEEREQYDMRLRAELFALMTPRSEHFLDDYREIAPGFWFPAKQGYDSFESDISPPQVRSHHEMRLVEAKVDAELTDELFKIELRDGVQVYDGRYDPPLAYKEKADRTPAEWQQLVDERKAQNEAWKKSEAARDELVGQDAPEPPKSTWLNSPALTLESLRGKVVVLDFWATWCGPCRNDLPLAEQLHQDTKDKGIVVIGVHAAGTESTEVEKLAKELGLHYPILLDLPGGDLSLGELANQLRVRGIPHSFLIDGQGRIAAHGRLVEVAAKALQIAKTGAK